jgi:hypothetical protein
MRPKTGPGKAWQIGTSLLELAGVQAEIARYREGGDILAGEETAATLDFLRRAGDTTTPITERAKAAAAYKSMRSTLPDKAANIGDSALELDSYLRRMDAERAALGVVSK